MLAFYVHSVVGTFWMKLIEHSNESHIWRKTHATKLIIMPKMKNCIEYTIICMHHLVGEERGIVLETSNEMTKKVDAEKFWAKTNYNEWKIAGFDSRQQYSDK